MAVRKFPNGGAGDRGFSRFPSPVILGAYTSQTFTSSGTFTAPMNAPLNENGKVVVYLTATAAGGKGGDAAALDTYHLSGQGGQAGSWCRRFRAELNPGESVSVTIPAAASGNGGSLTFGSYLTLSGGTQGAGGTSDPFIPQASSFNPSSGIGGAISSGSNANDNALRTGARGGKPHVDNNGTHEIAFSGGSNPVMGAFEGGSIAMFNMYSGGGGGAGLFGNGGNGSTSGGSAAAANSGGGGGGAGYSLGNVGGQGAAGQCLVEWRIA